MIVFLCSKLNSTLVNQGGVCDNAQIDIQQCRGGYLIGAWAIGGEVSCVINYRNDFVVICFALPILLSIYQDFVFPKDVAFAIGGPGAREYMMIEIHYNNPSMDDRIIIYI